MHHPRLFVSTAFLGNQSIGNKWVHASAWTCTTEDGARAQQAGFCRNPMQTALRGWDFFIEISPS